MAELNLPCDGCGERRYTRTPHGWTRCERCWPLLLSRTFIKPQLRGGLTDLPESWREVEPWPLSDVLRSGSLADFRYMAWRSLLHWYDRVPVYDVLDGWRINEVHFERDGEYKAIADVRALPLLIVFFGLVEPPTNSGYIAALVRSLIHARQIDTRPTWVYQASRNVLAPTPDPRGQELPKDTPPRALAPGLDPWS